MNNNTKSRFKQTNRITRALAFASANPRAKKNVKGKVAASGKQKG
jgi:hypothetical protein